MCVCVCVCVCSVRMQAGGICILRGWKLNANCWESLKNFEGWMTSSFCCSASPMSGYGRLEEIHWLSMLYHSLCSFHNCLS